MRRPLLDEYPVTDLANTDFRLACKQVSHYKKLAKESEAQVEQVSRWQWSNLAEIQKLKLLHVYVVSRAWKCSIQRTPFVLVNKRKACIALYSPTCRCLSCSSKCAMPRR